MVAVTGRPVLVLLKSDDAKPLRGKEPPPCITREGTA